MRTFDKIPDEFPAVSKLPPLSHLKNWGFFHGSHLLFVFAYTKTMNVTTNGAESWAKVVQEMQWRCEN